MATTNIESMTAIIDLSYGDCGKGKVTYCFCENENNKYTHVFRFNGGPNAGHTIYHKGQKFATHQIPTGIFFEKKCIIGPDCVVDVAGLFKEKAELEKMGVQVDGNLFIAHNAHIITDEHKREDGLDTRIGTTRRGIGPCYRDKVNRVGLMAKDVPELTPYLIDIYKEFYNNDKKATILCEGAQGFYLDIDWGDYPYVTSSSCTVGAIIQNGLPYNRLTQVVGVAKAYDTYVGAKKFQPEGQIYNDLRELGKEYGATTGRPRQCNFINIDALKKAADMNSIDLLIINKFDILCQLGQFSYIENNTLKTAEDKHEFQSIIITKVFSPVIFSESPYKI